MTISTAYSIHQSTYKHVSLKLWLFLLVSYWLSSRDYLINMNFNTIIHKIVTKVNDTPQLIVLHAADNINISHLNNLRITTLLVCCTLYYFFVVDLMKDFFFFAGFLDNFLDTRCRFVIVDIFGLSLMDGRFSNGVIDSSLSTSDASSSWPLCFLCRFEGFLFLSSISSVNPAETKSPRYILNQR